MVSENILSLQGVTKAFPGVLAMNNVSLDVKRGEVHALVGENGAGKSTLIKTITGAHKPDKGKIIFDGKEYDGLTPEISDKCGIKAVYQEFNLVGELTVAENVFLGHAIRKGIVIDQKAMADRTKELFDMVGIDIDPYCLVKNLTVGYQQLVEIIKAVSQNAKLLIMDEPTAPLTDNEVGRLFSLISRLKESGVTIIYISHRLQEIFEVSDSVTVMRDGEVIETMPTSETNVDGLIKLMVGRTLDEKFPPREEHEFGETIIEYKNVVGNGLKDVSFNVRKGEIVGLAGLIGAGRTELAMLTFGKAKLESGEIIFKGVKIDPKTPADVMAKGLALVPEDRKRDGALLHLSVGNNISLSALKQISKASVINRSKEKEMISHYVDSLRIKTPTVDQLTKNLSGGNQQKVVLAKSLATLPEFIIFDEPTRGIDVGAKWEIYKIMNDLIAEGKTILMISSEMEELIGMSDRIVVLAEGHKTGELTKDQFSQETILKYASQHN